MFRHNRNFSNFMVFISYDPPITIFLAEGREEKSSKIDKRAGLNKRVELHIR